MHRVLWDPGKGHLAQTAEKCVLGKDPILELGLEEGLGVNWTGEGRDAEGEEKISEGTACTLGETHRLAGLHAGVLQLMK